MPPDQQQLPTEGDSAMFQTDEQLAARVQQCENTVADLHYRTGVLARELESIRQQLQPG